MSRRAAKFLSALTALIVSVGVTIFPGGPAEDLAHASTTISLPTGTQQVSPLTWTAVCAESCTLAGFGATDEIRVVATSSNGAGLHGRVRLGASATTSGLAPVTGYNGGLVANLTATSGYSELAFIGTPSEVALALPYLEYKADRAGRQESIQISATLAGEGTRVLHYFPGNGHYYEFVNADISFSAAKSAAAGKTFNGLTGYLATILSAEENNFIKDKVSSPNLWIGGEFIPDNTSASPTYGDNEPGKWKWTVGPEANTVFWNGTRPGSSAGVFAPWNTGQPDGSAACLVTNYVGAGQWDDFGCSSSNDYLVEYGGLAGESPAKGSSGSFSVSAPYTITYDANGATSGSVPSSTLGVGDVVAGTPVDLVKAGASFSGWNTSADGSGTSVSAGATYSLSSDVTLYAQFPASVSVPSTPVEASTAVFQTIGTVGGVSQFGITGFTGDVRVVISSNDSSGQLRLSSTAVTGLRTVAGYDNSSSLTAGGDVIAFEATQAAANTALAALQYQSSGSTAKTDTITVQVANSGVPELQIGSYYHYYEFVDVLNGGGSSMSWDQAKTDSAIQRTFRGAPVTGWMATVGSEAENAWITKYLNTDAWLGGTDSELEGDWKWVTPADSLQGQVFWRGLSASSGGSVQNSLYANWAGIEPNNSGNEDCAQFYARSAKTVSVVVGSETLTRSAYWNDLPCSGTTLDGYIWEYRSTTSLTKSDTKTFAASVTPPDAPGLVTALSVVAGHKSATVSWTAPASTGSFPVSDYKVEYATNAAGPWTTFNDGTSTSTTATVTGLTPGSSYFFRVSAFNNVFGNTSATSVATLVPNPVPQNVTATPGNGRVTVAWQAPAVGTPTSYTVTQTPGGQTCTVSSTSCLFESLTNGTIYSYVVEVALSGDNTPYAASAVTATPVAPPSNSRGNQTQPPVTPPVLPPGTQPGRLPLPPSPTTNPQALPAPPQTQNNTSGPIDQPRALVGGVPAPVTTTQNGNSQLNVQTGSVQLGVLAGGGGSVQQNPQTNQPELRVPSGGSTSFTGGGLLPGSTLQVWLPGATNRELGRLPVAPDGTFQGEVRLSQPQGQPPLPIGRQVLQVTGFDANGNQTIVDMPVNIAQGPPAPEVNRELGQIPTLIPGQTLATSAGEPVAVNVIPFQSQNSVAVEGDGWNFSVNVEGGSGEVGGTPESPLIQFTQSGTGSVSGGGFLPETVASVWLFSDPTLLGTVTVAEDGSFTAEFLVDSQFIPTGEHTLQVQGVGEDGYIKAANLGVLVQEPAVATTASSAGTLLWWGLGALLVLAIAVAIVMMIARRKQA